MNVDFIFDFASPNAYLCHKAIQNLEKTHDIKFNYVPVSYTHLTLPTILLV